MKRDWGRSIGAMTGLAMGWAIMWALGLGGLTYAFIFGVSGTLIGGSIGARRTAATKHTR